MTLFIHIIVNFIMFLYIYLILNILYLHTNWAGVTQHCGYTEQQHLDIQGATNNNICSTLYGLLVVFLTVLL